MSNSLGDGGWFLDPERGERSIKLPCVMEVSFRISTDFSSKSRNNIQKTQRWDVHQEAKLNIS